MTLSPDGNRVLTSQANELYQIDLATGGSARLGTTAGDVVWAPDGRRFAHRTAAGIVARSVEDARESVLLAGNATAFPEDWSRDGRWVVVGMRTGATQIELLPAKGGERVPILSREDGISNADEMHFSPDGRWLAFNALSGARHKVFVVAKVLFDVGFSPAAIYDDYRVAPDGRFLVRRPGAQDGIRVIVNWPDLLTAQNTP